MTHFNLFVSNRMETLAGELVGALARPLPDPFSPEVVVVPNQGMSRWLGHRIAEALGVCANVDFPFPDQFLLEAARAVLGDLPDPEPFSLGVLPWRVLGLFSEVVDGPGGAPLAGYLDDQGGLGGGERKRLQLADLLARTFELYMIFRPSLLSQWESGAEPDDWQARLWRGLTSRCPGGHRATALGRLVAAAPTCRPEGLPERVHVFGVGALAPLRLRALEALSGCIEVNLYVLNPSVHYWADLRSARERARADRRRGAAPPASFLSPDEGNPLLASLGRQGRAFFDDLAALPVARAPDDLFVEPGEDTLLTCLQSDILRLRHRGVDGTPMRTLRPDDRSVTFHSCHSPLREVEVLHDWLLDLFGNGGPDGLEPRDVLVATPDVDTYAPLFQAVFGGVTEESCRIPHGVADRGVRAASPVADGFLRLLAVPGSRFGAQEVLDLLAVAPLARRFGLSGDDLAVVTRWVEETRIRWGVDEAHRERCGVPGFFENSWRAGLDRLLLGYALPGDGERLFEGVLPHGEVEGDGARVLGGVVGYTEALFALDRDLAEPRTPTAWAETLTEVLDRFFLLDDEEEHERLEVLRALTRMGERAKVAGYHEPLSLLGVRDHLTAVLEGEPSGGGVFTGRVTLCSLRPLRGIPFRVVALLGMNDGTFPRVERTPTFDRLVADPRPGDPNVRDEDRYLFLETLLSVRDRLLVSYVGRSANDDVPVPPSVVVSELQDAVAEGFTHPGGALPEALVTVHRLQGFHPDYFRSDTGLESRSQENLAGACALIGPRVDPEPLVPAPLPPPDEPWSAVDVDTLSRFYRHPARFFLHLRLGVYGAGAVGGLAGHEPFELGGLERYGILGWLADRCLAGEDSTGVLPTLRARGVLPPGRPGEVVFKTLVGEASTLAEAVRNHRAGDPLPPLDVAMAVGPYRVTGRLGGLWPGGRVCHRPANLDKKGKTQVVGWVEHLVLCAARGDDHPDRTVLVGLDRAFEFRPVGDPTRILEDLLDLYAEGLRAPLPLLSAASLAYATAVHRGKSEDEALGAAAAAWEGRGRHRGDRDDEDIQTCFRHFDILDERFREVARRVFVPLLDHRGDPIRGDGSGRRRGQRVSRQKTGQSG